MHIIKKLILWILSFQAATWITINFMSKQLVDYIVGTERYTLAWASEETLSKLWPPDTVYPHGSINPLPCRCYLIIINMSSGWSSCTAVLSACLLVGIQRMPCKAEQKYACTNKITQYLVSIGLTCLKLYYQIIRLGSNWRKTPFTWLSQQLKRKLHF